MRRELAAKTLCYEGLQREHGGIRERCRKSAPQTSETEKESVQMVSKEVKTK